MNPTLIVYRKELKEMLRDKRVRSSAIIMPMLLVIGMLAMFGLISGVGKKENQKVTIVKTDNVVVEALRKEKFQVTEVATVAEGEKLIREGKARVVLEFPPDFVKNNAAGKETKIKAYFDPQQQTARITLGETKRVLEGLNKTVKDAVLKRSGLSQSAIEPLQIEEKEVQIGKKDSSELLVALLPYFIVIWAFYGGFGSAGDLVAGEKEKSTLETLLITPVGRSQIAFGKFFALATICFLSSMSAVVGFLIAGLSKAPMFAALFPPEKGLGLGVPELLTIVAVLIPTVAFFASLLIAISTYAKNAREAQTYLAAVSFVVLMPAIFGQVIGLTDLSSAWWIRLVPVLNTSVALREALQGKTNLSGVLITVAVGAILAYIGIRIAVYLFKREQVLTRV